jgi:hypothetical protein
VFIDTKNKDFDRYVNIICSIITLVAVFCFIILEVIQFRARECDPWNYFKSVWNFLDIVIFTLYFVIFYIRCELDFYGLGDPATNSSTTDTTEMD